MKKKMPRARGLCALVLGLGMFVILGVRGTATADDPISIEKVPSFIAKLSAKLIGTNLTTAEVAGPFVGGRKKQYPKEELGLKIIAELENVDIGEDTMLYILWELCEEARSRPVWAAEIRRILPGTGMSAEYQNAILDALNGSNRLAALAELPIEAQEDSINIRDTFEEAKKIAGHIPKIFPIGPALVGAFDALEKHLIGSIQPGDCYEYDPGCQFGSNRGLISALSDRVAEDHDLAISVLRFALKMRHIDFRDPHPGNFQTNDKARIDIWPMALDAARGDVDRALETITVFGHDVCCNRLYAKNREDRFFVAVLNQAAPNVGNDSFAFANMFAPGALAGTQVPNSTLKRLHSALERYGKASNTTPTLRAGYYHVYGGVSDAQTLLSQGYGANSGLRLSTLLPEALGHFYKRIQLPRYLSDDAKVIWDAAENDESKVRASVPKNWDAARAELALSQLEMNLAILEYTQAQHRAGALFAFKVYKKAY